MKKRKVQLVEFMKPDFVFSDDRGSLTQLFREGWKQVNYITSKKNSYRGDHYHKNNEEFFFIISGSFTLKLMDIDNSHTEVLEIGAGSYFKILPNVLHSFSFHEETFLISGYSNGVEESDGMDIYTQKDEL